MHAASKLRAGRSIELRRRAPGRVRGRRRRRRCRVDTRRGGSRLRRRHLASARRWRRLHVRALPREIHRLTAVVTPVAAIFVVPTILVIVSRPPLVHYGGVNFDIRRGRAHFGVRDGLRVCSHHATAERERRDREHRAEQQLGEFHHVGLERVSLQRECPLESRPIRGLFRRMDAPPVHERLRPDDSHCGGLWQPCWETSAAAAAPLTQCELQRIQE